MSLQSLPSHRVITPVLTGPRFRPKLGRLGAFLLLLLLAVGLVLLWGLRDERRVVSSLPAPQRALAFQEALQRYQVLCREEGPSALQMECTKQAHYLRLFPECGATCQVLTDKDIPGPTR